MLDQNKQEMLLNSLFFSNNEINKKPSSIDTITIERLKATPTTAKVEKISTQIVDVQQIDTQNIETPQQESAKSKKKKQKVDQKTVNTPIESSDSAPIKTITTNPNSVVASTKTKQQTETLPPTKTETNKPLNIQHSQPVLVKPPSKPDNETKPPPVKAETKSLPKLDNYTQTQLQSYEENLNAFVLSSMNEKNMSPAKQYTANDISTKPAIDGNIIQESGSSIPQDISKRTIFDAEHTSNHSLPSWRSKYG
jgi:hypothetical protein